MLAIFGKLGYTQCGISYAFCATQAENCYAYTTGQELVLLIFFATCFSSPEVTQNVELFPLQAI